MVNNHNHSPSIVSSVARHERELLEKIEASEQEARDIVERARADARAHLRDEETKLAEEISAIRREREAKREREFKATVDAAEQRLAGVRAEAAQKVDGLAKEVMTMFMPNRSGGN